MQKSAKRIYYGNPMVGESYFDDDSSVPIIKDPVTGEDYSSLFVSGVNSVVTPGGKSTFPAHNTFSKKYMPHVSEFVSNSVTLDKKVLKAYLVRYAKSLRAYKDKYGHYPKQRIIGHSRGGGGALEIMEALAKQYPDLPRFDEYIGLDPYDFPFAGNKSTRRKNKTLVARRSIVVRPKRHGAIHSDASDLNGDGRISFGEKLRGKMANLMVMFGQRMNPFSRNTTFDVAVPGTNHSSVSELMDAAVALRDARSKGEAEDILKKMYPKDKALISTRSSALYGDSSLPSYEKVAYMLHRIRS